jgi:hypothetical protein
MANKVSHIHYLRQTAMCDYVIFHEKIFLLKPEPLILSGGNSKRLASWKRSCYISVTESMAMRRTMDYGFSDNSKGQGKHPMD